MELKIEDGLDMDYSDDFVSKLTSLERLSLADMNHGNSKRRSHCYRFIKRSIHSISDVPIVSLQSFESAEGKIKYLNMSNSQLRPQFFSPSGYNSSTFPLRNLVSYCVYLPITRHDTLLLLNHFIKRVERLNVNYEAIHNAILATTLISTFKKRRDFI